MTWFKVDDGFWSHPKVLTLSAEAVSLWVKSGSYCGKHLTDGYVSDEIISYLSRSDTAPIELVTAGLWLRVTDGYEFHDWSKYQDTRSDVEKRREAWKKRQAKARGQTDDMTQQKNDTALYNPFHSKGTRDSHSDSRRESRRDSEPVPMPETIKQWMSK